MRCVACKMAIRNALRACVWDELQKRLNKKLRNINISTKQDLIKFVNESWQEIPDSFIANCILSMPARLREVIKIKVFINKYE